MTITIPELSMVVLIGPSGSGKSTFARQHFRPTEILSSDACRGFVSDDENDQAATKDAFDVLHFIAAKRLSAGRLTVIDATNVQPEARKPLIDLAREYHVIPVALVLNLPERICADRNRLRPDRNFGPHVVRNQVQDLRRSLRSLDREGFRHIHVFTRPDELDCISVQRQPLWNNRTNEHGPYDIIGDVHGCFDELCELLCKLGYTVSAVDGAYTAHPPDGRRAIFVGDLVDRGPKIPAVLKLVMGMVDSGAALCVPGNHDIKLLRKLKGKNVQITHGLAESLEQLALETPEFREKVARFLDGLVSHYVFDDGQLVIAHAGMKEEMQGRGSGRVREFALFGETTGESDEFGFPVRLNWAAEYRGRALVVYGHTPVVEPEWLNGTVNIDTGCVFGGSLTALRYPEKELVSVPAHRTYYPPVRPFLPEQARAVELSVQHRHDDLLDIEDVLGKRIIPTRLFRAVTIREENAAAALEAVSRFAVNPKWLIYVPPTMAPPETSSRDGYLEHPDEAFAYFRHEGVDAVVCEQKHMGSRAIVILCRDESAAKQRFGVTGEGIGTCYTRTGRRFFSNFGTEQEFLSRLHRAVETSQLWEALDSPWMCLDCELMPWSAKAQELLRHQYAPTGAAARAALSEAIAALERAAAHSGTLAPLAEEHRDRLELVERYVEAYRRYCWSVRSVADLRLAPFHIMATEGRVHADRSHAWHLDTIRTICASDPEFLVETSRRYVDLSSSANILEAVHWWEDLTAKGGEGMVVKPLSFIHQGRRGIVQPAVKCRGREYLRIIYGPEYTREQHLTRLRQRALGAKRSLALREFALGIEGLERFTRAEPLRRVHECAFGVLALESEPIDPRL